MIIRKLGKKVSGKLRLASMALPACGGSLLILAQDDSSALLSFSLEDRMQVQVTSAFNFSKLSIVNSFSERRLERDC